MGRKDRGTKKDLVPEVVEAPNSDSEEEESLVSLNNSKQSTENKKKTKSKVATGFAALSLDDDSDEEENEEEEEADEGEQTGRGNKEKFSKQKKLSKVVKEDVVETASDDEGQPKEVEESATDLKKEKKKRKERGTREERKQAKTEKKKEKEKALQNAEQSATDDEENEFADGVKRVGSSAFTRSNPAAYAYASGQKLGAEGTNPLEAIAVTGNLLSPPNSKDLQVDQLSVQAFGKLLIKDSELNLINGRRYKTREQRFTKYIKVLGLKNRKFHFSFSLILDMG